MLDAKFRETIDFLELNLNLPMRFKEAIIENVNYILFNYYNSIDMIVLFGSCARGNPKLDSDIDLLILTKYEISKEDKIDIRAELCDTSERVSSDIIFYTYKNFKNSAKRLVTEIKKEGVVLWKKD